MPEPKKRKSHSASRLKRAHQKYTLPTLSPCPHCKELIVLSRVCPYCGYFKGKKVVELQEEVKTKVKNAE